ncbi:FAD-dependent oxidoreductase, partial [Bordetella pertussis]|uniref:FAD-dependent oxidoreductase n=1 Tax=Bordetella pertussis TaxID=520 RepID=UPI0012B22657
MKVAVIGAGWAGLAASVALREADAKVTVFDLDGGFRLSAPPLPAPLHAAAALLLARGL